MIKYIKNLGVKINLLHILIFYFIVNIILFHSFWAELFFDRSKIEARYGEVVAVEWTMDKVYQNIINGRNPFAYSNTLLYPFGTNFLSTDSGNGFFFVFLRPFLSEHQSLSVIVALSLFFSNICMYLLLRKLGFDKLISFLIGLPYGNMTFIMPRLGHLTYMSLYVFPLFFYAGYSLFRERKTKKKVVFTSLISISFVLALYLNLYYFVILLLSLGALLSYFLVFERKKFLSSCRLHWKYFIGWLFLTSILIYPWLLIFFQTKKFEDLPQAIGWGGAIQFSSDLFGYFIPSTYSYFMHFFLKFIWSSLPFKSAIFENFTYPGLIILLSYFSFVILLLKKKLPPDFLRQIKPFFYASICFFILTLGPFLHIFEKWGITVDEGIRIVIPLPYIILHYLPFMANIRVPSRLIVGFIFFAYIVCAYLIKFFLKNKSLKFKKLFLLLFLIVFFIDHYFYITNPNGRFIPNKLYEEIRKDSSQITVMEVPSAVRDGFVYFGNPDALDFIAGQMKHGKPVLGGYFGRVPQFKVDYYQRNPFLGFIGRLIDPSLEHKRNLNKTEIDKWENIDFEKSSDAVNFLDLKYFLLNEEMPYVATLSATLQTLGFSKKMNENYYSLWQRTPEIKEFLNVDIGSTKDDMYLGMGWSQRELGFRWSGRKSSVLFKLNKIRKLNLNFIGASFYREQNVTIYINKSKIAKIKLPEKLTEFSLQVNEKKLQAGINFVYFIFDRSYKPKNFIPESFDNRDLSAKFTKVYLIEN